MDVIVNSALYQPSYGLVRAMVLRTILLEFNCIGRNYFTHLMALRLSLNNRLLFRKVRHFHDRSHLLLF